MTETDLADIKKRGGVMFATCSEDQATINNTRKKWKIPYHMMSDRYNFLHDWANVRVLTGEFTEDVFPKGYLQPAVLIYSVTEQTDEEVEGEEEEDEESPKKRTKERKVLWAWISKDMPDSRKRPNLSSVWKFFKKKFILKEDVNEEDIVIKGSWKDISNLGGLVTYFKKRLFG